VGDHVPGKVHSVFEDLQLGEDDGRPGGVS